MTRAHKIVFGLLIASAGFFGAVQAQAQTQASADDTAPPKAAMCVACHGVQGRSAVAMFPILAGQSARYMNLQLRDYQAGRRSNALMSPMAMGLTRDEMRELSDYFSKQKPGVQNFVADADKARLGKAKAEETLCTMCHAGAFAGMNEVPKVSGQHFDYIVKQLTDFKAHARTNDGGNMTSVSGTLSEQDIQNLAHYIVGL